MSDTDLEAILVSCGELSDEEQSKVKKNANVMVSSIRKKK